MRRRARWLVASLIAHLLLVQALRLRRKEAAERAILELEPVQLAETGSPAVAVTGRIGRTQPLTTRASPARQTAPPTTAQRARRATPSAPRSTGAPVDRERPPLRPGASSGRAGLLAMRRGTRFQPPLPEEAARAPEDGPLYADDPDELSHATYPLRSDGQGNLIFEDRTFTAVIAADGALRFRDRANVQPSCGPAISFDVTEAVMRARGEDPYRYEKRRFARATATLRARLRRRHDSQRRAAALAALPAHLRRVWRRHHRRPPRLRRMLFSLWDECEERRKARNPRPIAIAGEDARARIIDFIRRKLPCSSELAYSRAELAHLNRERMSRQRFAPCEPGPRSQPVARSGSVR